MAGCGDGEGVIARGVDGGHESGGRGDKDGDLICKKIPFYFGIFYNLGTVLPTKTITIPYKYYTRARHRAQGPQTQGRCDYHRYQ